jgi:hypothetical protein
MVLEAVLNVPDVALVFVYEYVPVVAIPPFKIHAIWNELPVLAGRKK